MKRRDLTITRDHFVAIFINSDGQRLLLMQDRGRLPVLYDTANDDQPVEVDEVQKLPGSATTWVASGLILASDEGVWLTTSLLAAARWLRRNMEAA